MAEKSRYVTAGITGSTSEIADSNNMLGINPWHNTVPLDSMQRLHCNREATVAYQATVRKVDEKR